MPRFDTAAAVINSVAVETGLTAVADPFASTDPIFIQLRGLLTNAGRELLGLHEWQKMIKTYTKTTVVPPDTGDYALPDNFGRFIDQTGWVPSSKFPLGGPLSPQDWTYLVATNLASSTIYVSFRQAQGLFRVLPQPPANGVTITFEYVSRNWVLAADAVTEKDSVSAAADTVWFEPILIAKFLKLRFLEAKGFDSTAAMNQFSSVFMQWTGKDVSAPILRMARRNMFPYLGYRNIPETGYGLP